MKWTQGSIKVTSRHHRARRDGRKQKTFKIVMFNSQESRVNRSQGLEKRERRNIQELRPGRNATQ